MGVAAAVGVIGGAVKTRASTQDMGGAVHQGVVVLTLDVKKWSRMGVGWGGELNEGQFNYGYVDVVMGAIFQIQREKISYIHQRILNLNMKVNGWLRRVVVT